MKKLLFSTGFNNIWYEQNAPSTFIYSFTQRIKDIYQQQWFEKLSLSSKCDYYTKLKSCISSEYYLSCVTIRKFRVSLARFRCSSHDLWIEKGRYLKMKREDRLCKSCNTNLIENEYHFLLVCPLYNELRKKYIRELYFVHPSIDTFSALMTCKNQNVIQNLAMFIYHAFKRRNCEL